ncbi:MAG: histidine phosphatase family protein, partial [Chloroflexi bacterium]|nr:histidine phosphatase family protein [Chloroflexota bacterium]
MLGIRRSGLTRFYLVRHGQTEWNRVERFRGRVDIPLNATGVAQA